MVKNKTGNKSGIEFSLKERILKLLIENKEPISILQVSNQLKADYKNTFNAIHSYSDVIIKNKQGNTSFIELKIAPSQEIYSIEKKRTEELLSKHPKLKIIRNYLEELNYPFLIVLVFGSYAKGKETENSDIDLCIISDNKNKINELIRQLGLLSLKLEIQDFSSGEFISMIEKKQNNVGNEIIKNNIILYGAENYYNLVSKWMKKE